MKLQAVAFLVLMFGVFFIRWKYYENYPNKKFKAYSKKEAISGVVSLASFLALIITDFKLFGLLGFISFIATIMYSFGANFQIFYKKTDTETAKWFVDPGFNVGYELCPHCGKAKVRKNELFKKCPVCKKRF